MIVPNDSKRKGNHGEPTWLFTQMPWFLIFWFLFKVVTVETCFRSICVFSAESRLIVCHGTCWTIINRFATSADGNNTIFSFYSFPIAYFLKKKTSHGISLVSEIDNYLILYIIFFYEEQSASLLEA